MGIKIESTHFRDLKIIATELFEDERGFFMEVFRADQFRALGLPDSFVQDNHSRSAKGVLRGMHFQWDPPQGKLIRVTQGRAFLALVDIRIGSPTLGKWFGIELSAPSRKQIWAPPGFANGFCALSDVVEIQYKCTGVYNRQSEGSILWNDPAVGIAWPVGQPILSAKDGSAQTLAQWLSSPHSDRFRY